MMAGSLNTARNSHKSR